MALRVYETHCSLWRVTNCRVYRRNERQVRHQLCARHGLIDREESWNLPSRALHRFCITRTFIEILRRPKALCHYTPSSTFLPYAFTSMVNLFDSFEPISICELENFQFFTYTQFMNRTTRIFCTKTRPNNIDQRLMRRGCWHLTYRNITRLKLTVGIGYSKI